MNAQISSKVVYRKQVSKTWVKEKQDKAIYGDLAGILSIAQEKNDINNIQELKRLRLFIFK